MQSYPIPQGLWESLDAILFNKAIALAKDIATELNVSPQLIIDIIKREDRSRFTIIPDDDTLYQCQALVQRSSVYMRCRCPTLTPTRLCTAHTNYAVDTPKLPEVQRIITPDSTYIMNGTEVFNIDKTQYGVLKGSTLTLFEIEESKS